MTKEHTTMRYPYPNPKPEEIAVFFLRDHSLPQIEHFIARLEADAQTCAEGVSQHLLSTVYGAKFALELVRSTLDCHAPLPEVTECE